MMGSASREALERLRSVADDNAEEAVATELLQAADLCQRQSALAVSLAEQSAPAEAKTALIDRAFAALSQQTRHVIAQAAAQHWSQSLDFAAAIEELGVHTAGKLSEHLDEELLAVADLIDTHHELELSLGAKLADSTSKIHTLERLLGSKISQAALAITQQLAVHPRGRRLSAALHEAAKTAAAAQGKLLARVRVAETLDREQHERLERALSQSYQQPVKLSCVVDQTLLGGVSVQINDEIIDGTVRRRLDDLRLQLTA